jgi:hypothetical protein
MSNPMADQIAAAGAEAQTVFGRLSHLPSVEGGSRQFYRGDQASWIGAALRRHLQIVQAGEAYVCDHLVMTGPQVCYMALWRPDAVVCEDCLTGSPVLQLSDDDPRNRTCDECGEFRPQGVRSGIAQSGHYVILYGQCTICLERETDVGCSNAGHRD